MLEIGVDEVGCSSIMGPVSACAVIVEKGQKKVADVNDSKQLTKSKRESLVVGIKNGVLAYGVGSASVQEIKKLNIFWAKFLAMRRAISFIVSKGFIPDKIWVDGNREIPNIDYNQEAIIRGDSKKWEIGAASIIAKVTRDNLLADLEENIKQYSYYDIKNNAGYFTIPHMKGIIKNGFSDLHRQEFVYSKFCISLHKEYMKGACGLGSVDNWLASEYGDRIDLEDDWALYKYWKTKKQMKLKSLGWD